MPHLTATLPLVSTALALSPEITLRHLREDDTEALAHLYLAVYPPGVACATPEEARADIVREYGPLCLDASPLVW